METSELVEETGVQLPVGISEGLGLSSKKGSKRKGGDPVAPEAAVDVAASEGVKEEDKMEIEEEKVTEEQSEFCIG